MASPQSGRFVWAQVSVRLPAFAYTECKSLESKSKPRIALPSPTTLYAKYQKHTLEESRVILQTSYP